MTLRLSPHIRLLAALLAALGLTAAPLRAFAPCEMQATVQAEPDVHAAHGAHGAHAMHMSDVATPPVDAPSPDAKHPGPCLDLTHCAVMAWTPLATRLPQVLVQVTRRIAEPDARLSSVGRSIDTPPPKRA